MKEITFETDDQQAAYKWLRDNRPANVWAYRSSDFSLDSRNRRLHRVRIDRGGRAYVQGMRVDFYPALHGGLVEAMEIVKVHYCG